MGVERTVVVSIRIISSLAELRANRVPGRLNGIERNETIIPKAKGGETRGSASGPSKIDAGSARV